MKEMEGNDQQLEKIYKFVRNDLPKEESDAFEKEIEASNELQKLVSMIRFEKEVMEQLVKEELEDEIKNWESADNEILELKKPKKLPYSSKWLLLIVIALFALLYYYNISDWPKEPQEEIDNNFQIESDQSPKENETIESEPESPNVKEEKIIAVEEYPSISPSIDLESKNTELIAFAQYELPLHLRSLNRSVSPEQLENPLIEGRLAITQGNFLLAIEKLESIDSTKEPELYNASIVPLAHAYFNNKQFDEAALLFQSIIEDNNISFKNDPEWYLLLSLIPNFESNKNQIRLLIDKISNDDLHKYQNKVIELNKELPN